MRFKIDWATLIDGSKCTFFALFHSVFEGNFPSTSCRVAYIWRGDLTVFFFFALPVWGAYIWRGLYMEGLIFGILRYFCPKWGKWKKVSAGRVLLLSLKLKKSNKEVKKSHLLSISAFNFPLFTSFQELDLSAETLIKNITPREDEWLKVITKGLHPKGQYTKVLINHCN